MARTSLTKTTPLGAFGTYSANLADAVLTAADRASKAPTDTAPETKWLAFQSVALTDFVESSAACTDVVCLTWMLIGRRSSSLPWFRQWMLH